MPHPFFDSPTYPWKRADAKTFYKRLSSAVTAAADIQALYQDSGGDAGQTPQPKTPAKMWREVLDELALQLKLSHLCAEIISDNKYAGLHVDAKAVQEAQDVVLTLASEEGLIFLDRKQLRLSLQKLWKDSAYSVLVVRGESGSGKTWTERKITEIVRSMGERAPVFMGSDMVGTVQEVMDTLFRTLGGTAPESLESEDAWFRRACLDLQERAQQQKSRLWIIVDDLGEDEHGPRLDTAIRRFFEQLVLQMASPHFNEWFRIILLDYPKGPTPTKWRKIWLEDLPSADSVVEKDIQDFLLEWATLNDKQLATDRATSLAKDIVQKATSTPANGIPPLQRIHDEIESTLVTL